MAGSRRRCLFCASRWLSYRRADVLSCLWFQSCPEDGQSFLSRYPCPVCLLRPVRREPVCRSSACQQPGYPRLAWSALPWVPSLSSATWSSPCLSCLLR